ncbi:MAG: homocysteine S-methyltransferase family protein [Candidatus Gracilibacteria bacterium]
MTGNNLVLGVNGGSQECSTLFGPYGTRLEQIGAEIGNPEIVAPTSVLTSQEAREAVARVAGEYIDAGARVATINAFGLRGLLHEGERRLYEEAILGQQNAMLQGVRTYARDAVLKALSLSVGPYGDCYKPEEAPDRGLAKDFHELQVQGFEKSDADVLWFETIATIEEAVGIGQAAAPYVPTVISFIIDRDGRLLSGECVRDAIKAVDDASGRTVVGYSFNCCPIEGLTHAFASTEDLGRVIACYPNASSADPRELCGSDGVQKVEDPKSVGQYLRFLAKRFNLSIVGGCCGHDHESVSHISAIPQNDCHFEWHSLGCHCYGIFLCEICGVCSDNACGLGARSIGCKWGRKDGDVGFVFV